jgi:metal-sulfur cluster biosynthetic enzyme
MLESQNNLNIIDALEKVEHPSIATTLLNLGMLRDIVLTPDAKVSLTLVLPFQGVPDTIRDYMVNSLATAANSAGGELTKISLAVMNEEERQNFLTIEQQNWRG